MSRSTFFQCFNASASFSRSTSTHFPLMATRPPTDSRSCSSSDSVSGSPSSVTFTEKSSRALALNVLFLRASTLTLTTGRGGWLDFHQSGTRTTRPLSSKTGMS